MPADGLSGLVVMSDKAAAPSSETAIKLSSNEVVSLATEKPVKIPQNEILGACRSVKDFEKLNRIGEGTYGIVYRARDIISKEIVALKKIRMESVKEGKSTVICCI